ncbi:hypothetical protein HDU83_000828 [Entophlyctis luteolus]|nr:hypothetical protein HDU83_000828 [Entophlyctis luteolus]KAJ3389095.1 hypothetical protein HDU84_009191 [Entophlyctis sp. JEL0112]
METLPHELLELVSQQLHPADAMTLQYTGRIFASLVTFNLGAAVRHMRAFAVRSCADDAETDISTLNRNYATAHLICYGFTRQAEKLLASATSSSSHRGRSAAAAQVLLLRAMQHPIFDPTVDDHRLLRWIAGAGHAHLLSPLLRLPSTEPGVGDDYAVRTAARHGHTRVVEMLAACAGVNAGAGDNCAIRTAAQKGHAGVVAVLLRCERGVDPAARQNAALRVARYYGHREIERMLLESGRVGAADSFAAPDDNRSARDSPPGSRERLDGRRRRTWLSAKLVERVKGLMDALKAL